MKLLPRRKSSEVRVAEPRDLNSLWPRAERLGYVRMWGCSLGYRCSIAYEGGGRGLDATVELKVEGDRRRESAADALYDAIVKMEAIRGGLSV